MTWSFAVVAERDPRAASDRAGDPSVRLQHRPRLPHPDDLPGQLLRDQLLHARNQNADADCDALTSLCTVKR